jgi:superfamily II DNA or RNA helicase
MLPLRDYQSAALEALRASWGRGTRRAAAVLPTGAGKTVVFAHLARDEVSRGGRVLVLAHRDELISQAVDKLHDVAPGLRVGIVKAAREETAGRDVVVASVQSLARQTRRYRVGRAGFTLIIVDECHHAIAPTYMNVIKDFGGFDENRQVKVAGFTATLTRGDRGALSEVWEEVAFTLGIADLIRRGYLCNAKGMRVAIEGLDLRRVKRIAGDYSSGALSDAMSEALAPQAIARAYKEHAVDRQGIVFTPSVALAYEVAEAFGAAGLTAEAADGSTDSEERRSIIKRFRHGDTQMLINCGLFTEGTDLPMTSAVVIARPTSSAGLYVQMAGRGLRTHPGKSDCLIMDVVGVTGRHRLASLVDLGGGELTDGLTEAERAELSELEDELGLLELIERGSGALPTPVVDGKLVTSEVDLFGESIQAWHRTYGGTWFLEAQGVMIALAPVADGKYDVCQLSLNAQGGAYISRGMDIGYAMAWGEKAFAEIETSWGVEKTASWRRGKASDAQREKLARMGVALPEGASKGDASAAISIHLASRRVDHLPIFRGQ